MSRAIRAAKQQAVKNAKAQSAKLEQAGKTGTRAHAPKSLNGAALATVIDVPFWRALPSRGRKKPIGKFGIDMGERGVYDKRNALNELTGKEWTYFLNSVWVKAYPPVADQCGFDLRKVHPCPKPPFLMRDIVQFFTKGGQWILDPFAGVGGTLLGASLADAPRNAVGIELNRTYVDAYRKASGVERLARQTMIRGDSLDLLDISAVRNREFDLILTDPPYSDLMSRPKNGHKNKLYGRGDATPFSNLRNDLGNLTYSEYLEALTKVMSLGVSRLRNKKYLVIFCRDLQPIEGKPNLLHADVVNALIRIPGLQYRGMRIWHDQAVDLYPFGYPYAFVMNQMHQYILIFRKVLPDK
jgi:DNA modification methylase